MSNPLNDLQEIRKMMEKSSRFLSLSGLSGVAAGVVALAAAFFAYQYKNSMAADWSTPGSSVHPALPADYLAFLIRLAAITLILGLLSGIFFTWRKARKQADGFWNPVSKKLVVNMAIPLLAGGAVIITLLVNGVYWIIPELTLIFYGLALISASQYTYRDVFYLGLSELILGVLALIVSGYSLFFWAAGFGVLHILYGVIMHYKYDRKTI